MNAGSIKKFKLLVLICLVISDLYLFHLIVLLNPHFNCSKNLLSTSVDKVTIATYSFVSFTLKDAFVGALIAGLAGLSPCAATAACVIILVKIQF